MSPKEFTKVFGFAPDRRVVKKGTIVCPQCLTNPATVDRTYGILICEACKIRREDDREGRLGGYPEFVGATVKEERKKYLKSQIQSHRGGQLSAEFVKHYPDQIKGMVKKGVVTREEVRRARPVWQDLPGYSQLDRSL